MKTELLADAVKKNLWSASMAIGSEIFVQNIQQ